MIKDFLNTILKKFADHPIKENSVCGFTKKYTL